MGCLIVFLVIVGISVLVGVFTWISGSSNDGSRSSNNSSEAIAQCEARIDRLLKSPSTADYDDSASSSGSSKWVVTGTVDSENSFGASLRSSFQCTVIINGDSATTTVDYLN